ncbi:ATP-grasp domain-containing protein, partial [Listeria monocytogenes]|nr:ATP-grasp domain-containing protein [Listeria monocytogenes]
EAKLQDTIYKQIIFLPDFDDFERARSTILTINQDFPLSLVTTFSEKKQPLVSKICDSLNLNGPSKTSVELLNNKYLMRKKLENKNLLETKFSLVNCRDDIYRFIEYTDFPVVLKPIDGIGGEGITLIENEQNLNEVEEDIKNYIVEEFIQGKEFSIEAVGFKGEHQIFTITEKIKDSKMNEIGHIIPYNQKFFCLERAQEYINTLFSILAIDQGITHTEIIVNEDGIYLVESHLRMGGNHIGEMIEMTLGINMSDIYAKSMIRGSLYRGKIEWNGTYAEVLSIFPNESGVIEEILAPEKIENCNKIFYLKSVGDFVLNKGNSNRILSFIKESHSYNHLKDSVKSDIEKFRIKIDTKYV